MVDHGIWETTTAGNRRVIGRIFDLFRQIFPNVPVYSTIGNHEGEFFDHSVCLHLLDLLDAIIFSSSNQFVRLSWKL